MTMRSQPESIIIAGGMATAPRGRAFRRRDGHKVRNRFVIAAVVFLIGGAAAWYAFVPRTAPTGISVPVIHAEAGLIKLKPDQPGGIEIPYQNISVYDKISKGGGQLSADMEKLLPAPELPQITEILPAQDGDGGAAAPVDAQAGPSVAKDSAILPSVQGEVNSSITKQGIASTKMLEPAVTTAPVVDVKDMAKPSDVLEEKKAPIVQGPGRYSVQLASVPNETQAKGKMAALQKAHGDVLGGVPLGLARADLAGRGTYYRIRAGGLEEGQARDLCGKLKSKGVGCILVRP